MDLPTVPLVTVRRRLDEKQKLTPDKLADLKSKSQYRVSKKYGHWSTDHNQEGCLKPNVLSKDQPSSNNDGKNDAGSENQSSTTMQFNSAHVIINHSDSYSDFDIDCATEKS